MGVAVVPWEITLGPLGEASLGIAVPGRPAAKAPRKDHGMPDRHEQCRQVLPAQWLEAHESTRNSGGLGAGRGHTTQSGRRYTSRAVVTSHRW